MRHIFIVFYSLTGGTESGGFTFTLDIASGLCSWTASFAYSVM